MVLVHFRWQMNVAKSVATTRSKPLKDEFASNFSRDLRQLEKVNRNDE